MTTKLTPAPCNQPFAYSNFLLNKFAGSVSIIGWWKVYRRFAVVAASPKERDYRVFRLPELIIILIFLLPFVANILGVSELIRIAKAKGHYTDGAGLLWFIGLCGTALMLGLIVCALPDRGIPATRTSYTRNDDTLPEV